MDKVQEIRCRRKADRQGLKLTKNARRDPRAVGYGLYALIDVQTGGAINPTIADLSVHSWSLDQVEAYLDGDRRMKIIAKRLRSRTPEQVRRGYVGPR